MERKLDRMRALLSLLGTPQAAFRTVLVAGTKGKGSIAAILTSILQAAGYRVGRYTQPHLYSYRERIWVAGDYIAQEALIEALDGMRPALDLVQREAAQLGPLTTFDVGTALALMHFARSQVEIAVVEVGVGGANDATNALEPVAVAIGPIGLDHLDVLGSTVAEVAHQKAGVMRMGIEVAVGRQEPSAAAVLAEEASAHGARMQYLGVDFDWWAERSDATCAGPFTFRDVDGVLADLHLGLIGHFQRDNAAQAIALARGISDPSHPIGLDSIRAGLAMVQWPGRVQIVARQPLTILDGAHNQTAAQALGRTLRDYLDGRPATLVVGMSDTKDVAATLAELAGIADRVIATQSSHPRACDPEQIAAAADHLGIPTEIRPGPADALLRAWELVEPDGAVLVTGSLFLVGDVLEYLWRAG
ncbi:MAG TPA: folylpolyglutamate synthase/dihydrofolate synthase family protein [Chloroflexota bacterium]